jgi:hypothetical protein
MQLMILTQKPIIQKEKYLWIWNVQNEWYNGKKIQGKQQVEQPFSGIKKKIT